MDMQNFGCCLKIGWSQNLVATKNRPAQFFRNDLESIFIRRRYPLRPCSSILIPDSYEYFVVVQSIREPFEVLMAVDRPLVTLVTYTILRTG